MTMAADLAAAIAAAGWMARLPADPATPAEALAILRPLYETGRRDLPLARLLEGHVDAVQIIRRYGTAAQTDRLDRWCARGAMLGVWNAALPAGPLRIVDGQLRGGKSYASGAGILTHALVTAEDDGGMRLILVDLAATPPMIDRDWWRVTGMQRSATHRIHWADAAIDPDALIGAAGDYPREPFFSGGALRFVAVHAGGIAGLCDRTRDHLAATGRADDPFQTARLAELFMAADSAACAVRHAATIGFDGSGEARLAQVAAARLIVTDAAERAMAVAQQAVGLGGHFTAHPLSALLTDLAVYLRQPAPDAQRLRVGRAVGTAVLTPSL